MCNTRYDFLTYGNRRSVLVGLLAVALAVPSPAFAKRDPYEDLYRQLRDSTKGPSWGAVIAGAAVLGGVLLVIHVTGKSGQDDNQPGDGQTSASVSQQNMAAIRLEPEYRPWRPLPSWVKGSLELAVIESTTPGHPNSGTRATTIALVSGVAQRR